MPSAEVTTSELGGNLGYRFSDPQLLQTALTHRSFCAEHAGVQSNERLEFLGDSVLGFVVTDRIYRSRPFASEGEMSRMRASVVCAQALAEMATEIGLGKYLRLGKGEDASGGRERQSILSDAMEAVVGATFLDGGQDQVARLIDRLIEPRLAEAGSPDDKSRLHEYAAQRELAIRYDISERGPEHDKMFSAAVVVGNHRLGIGQGRSKKRAEQMAASAAWNELAAAANFEKTEETHG